MCALSMDRPRFVVNKASSKSYLPNNYRLHRNDIHLWHSLHNHALHHWEQKTCYFGDIHEELPIAKATVSQHLKELKDAGLIQGELETPKVKYLSLIHI